VHVMILLMLTAEQNPTRRRTISLILLEEMMGTTIVSFLHRQSAPSRQNMEPYLEPKSSSRKLTMFSSL